MSWSLKFNAAYCFKTIFCTESQLVWKADGDGHRIFSLPVVSKKVYTLALLRALLPDKTRILLLPIFAADTYSKSVHRYPIVCFAWNCICSVIGTFLSGHQRLDWTWTMLTERFVSRKIVLSFSCIVPTSYIGCAGLQQLESFWEFNFVQAGSPTPLPEI